MKTNQKKLIAWAIAIALSTGNVCAVNAASGVSANNENYVTGAEVAAAINEIRDQLTVYDDTLGNHNSSIALLDNRLVDTTTKANTAYNTLQRGFTIMANGKSVAQMTSSNAGINFVAGDHVILEKYEGGPNTYSNHDGIQIGVDSTNKIEAGNQSLITSDAVYQAIKDIPVDANLAGKASTALDNLSEAGEKKIADAAKNAAADKADTAYVDKGLAGKADIDAANIDVSQWTKKLAAGAVADGNTGLVTGGAVYTAVSGRALVDGSNIDAGKWSAKLGTGANESGNKGLVTGDTLNKALAGFTGGKTYTGSDTITISKDNAISVAANGKVESNNKGIVTGGDVAKAIADATAGFTTDANLKKKADKDYVDQQLAGKADKADFDKVKTQVDANTQGIKKNSDDIKALQETSANKDLSNLSDAGKKVISDSVSGAVSGKADKSEVDAVKKEVDSHTEFIKNLNENKANTDASNIDTAKYAEKLGTGVVENGNTSLVNGGTVYNAITQLKNEAGVGLVTVSDGTVNIAKDSDASRVNVAGTAGNRVVTGVVTDASDGYSAANVNYVNTMAGDLASSMDAMNHKLTEDIGNAGAVASALAALHPLDYDPDNKLDVAVGTGTYRGTTAGALGFFYRPNEAILFSAGATVCADNNAWNAGLSFKLGSGSAYNTTSKAAMASEISHLKTEKEAMGKQMAGMNEEIQQLKSQVEKLLKAMKMSDNVERSIVK